MSKQPELPELVDPNNPHVFKMPEFGDEELTRDTVVYITLDSGIALGYVRLAQISNYADFNYYNRDIDTEGCIGYYAFKDVKIVDGRKVYRSKMPLAIFVGHGHRPIASSHSLRGYSWHGRQSLDSRQVIQELNEKLDFFWQLPKVQVFVSCDQDPETGLYTRWDMMTSDQNQVVGVALGLNYRGYSVKDDAIVIHLDTMHRKGVKLDVTKSQGKRREVFDSLFYEEKQSFADWMKWVFNRERNLLKEKIKRR